MGWIGAGTSGSRACEVWLQRARTHLRSGWLVTVQFRRLVSIGPRTGLPSARAAGPSPGSLAVAARVHNPIFEQRKSLIEGHCDQLGPVPLFLQAFGEAALPSRRLERAWLAIRLPRISNSTARAVMRAPSERGSRQQNDRRNPVRPCRLDPRKNVRLERVSFVCHTQLLQSHMQLRHPSVSSVASTIFDTGFHT
jgi:hypothetical protein